MRLSSIHSFYFHQKSWHKQLIFGQRSKGVPGIEIIGLKSQGRLIQEKIIYLTRYLDFKIPLGRYSLCVDFDSYDSKADYRDLELAFLLLYWELAGLIPIKNIQNCFIWGRIKPPNKLSQIISNDQINRIKDQKVILLECSDFSLSEIIGSSRLNFELLDQRSSAKILYG